MLLSEKDIALRLAARTWGISLTIVFVDLDPDDVHRLAAAC